MASTSTAIRSGSMHEVRTLLGPTMIRRVSSAALLLVVAAILEVGLLTTDAIATGGERKPTIVLVHGAWADGSSWSRVVRNLQEAGYPVVAPPNPLRGLSSDAAYLSSYLQTIHGPIVLVGHSYGGAVISNTALGDADVRALVYVNAFIPKQDEDILHLAGAVPGSCLAGDGDPTQVFDFVPYPGAPSGDVDLYVKRAPNGPYPGFHACFANDLPAAKASQLAASQRPVTLSALAEPSGSPTWKTLPSWAVIGTLDNVIPKEGQRLMARRAGATITRIKASHLSMISRPRAVTDVIVSADRETR